jgi:hypothetical protein
MLINGQLHTDAEVDVVVDGEPAHHEKADECTEVNARKEAGHDVASGRVDFRVENRCQDDADENTDHAKRHDLHHALFRAINVRIFLEFRPHRRPRGEHSEAVREVSDRAAQRCQHNP